MHSVEHFKELKAVQASRIPTFGLALISTVFVLYDQFIKLLFQ